MKRFLFVLLALAGSWVACGAQQLDSLMAYLQHAMLFSKVTPQEKVYLHFDNTGYFKGETMWFKAYVTKAQANDGGVAEYVPTTLSHVLYVELLSPSGDVIAKRKLKVENGVAHGDILLDSIIGTGFYEVRAFTRYMRNFGDGCEFSRVFPIFEAPAQEGDYSKHNLDQASYRKRLPDMRTDTKGAGGAEVKGKGIRTYHFYPEGGDLVEGLTSRVAFTVTDRDKGETERGLIEVTPGAAQTVSFTGKDGQSETVSLPAAKKEGFVMKVDAVSGDDVTADFACSPGLQGQLVAWVLLHNGSIVACDTMTAAPSMHCQWSRSELPDGVNQLTLFGTRGQILAERLFFLCPADAASDSIDILSETYTLKPCGEVALQLHTRPNAELSFSAMDAGTMTNGKQGNIKTWMLLSSDLRGYIENPEYYFESDDPEHRYAADLLMLIQGWRRYDWELIGGTKPFAQPIQPIEDKLYVIGKLAPSLNKWIKNNPVDNVDLTAYLYNRQGAHMKGETTTDKDGNYAFQLPDIDGDWSMQIHTRIEDKLKTYTVAIDRHFSPASRTIWPQETEMTEANTPNLFRLDKMAQGKDDAHEESALMRVGNREFVIPTVKVKAKKHYWTDYSGGWYDEKDGRRKASLYYDCDAASDEIADRGEVQPTVYEWLETKNEFFIDGNLIMDDSDGFLAGVTNTMGSAGTGAPGEGTVSSAFDSLPNTHADGPCYKRRPTIWILNNKYAAATGVTFKIPGGAYIKSDNTEHMPMFLNEVKAVYISEDANAFDPFLTCSDLKGNNPVTVFVYTHPTYSTASNKGIRRTHFDGFNVPQTFEMEDYSVLPPMDDFRRTLYWQPSLQSDGAGVAKVKFYNNSTCKELYISVEGMTNDGTFVANNH